MLPRMRVIGSEWRLQMTDEITSHLDIRMRSRVDDEKTYSQILEKEGSVPVLPKKVITELKKKGFSIVEEERGEKCHFLGPMGYISLMSSQVDTFEDVAENQGLCSLRGLSDEQASDLIWALQRGECQSSVRINKNKYGKGKNDQNMDHYTSSLSSLLLSKFATLLIWRIFYHHIIYGLKNDNITVVTPHLTSH